MHKPLLIVVTGRPASGKSTLAGILTKEIKCPLLSRDALKEGYINTLGVLHRQLDAAAALHLYATFFEVIDLLLSHGVSVIAEAAFQDKLWKPKLLALQDKAEIRVIICEIEANLAKTRFKSRLLDDPDRDRFHGDLGVAEKGGLLTDTYEPVSMDVPTLVVDTTHGYRPGIEEIIDFIRRPL